MSEKYTFQDFSASVDGENQVFVSELHDELTALGCKADVKSAKSGYVVSYSLNKKTIANYVFRKKGLTARIYAGHVKQYMGILDTLPDGMVCSIQKASICKRLVDPAACNQRCSMGYDFILQGERLQRCLRSTYPGKALKLLLILRNNIEAGRWLDFCKLEFLFYRKSGIWIY